MFTKLIKKLTGSTEGETGRERGHEVAAHHALSGSLVEERPITRADLVADAPREQRGRVHVEQPRPKEWREQVNAARSPSQLWMSTRDPELLLWLLHMSGERREYVWKAFAHWCALQVIPLMPRDAQGDARDLINAVMLFVQGQISAAGLETPKYFLEQKLQGKQPRLLESVQVDEVTVLQDDLSLSAAISAVYATLITEPTNAADETFMLASIALQDLRTKEVNEEFRRRAAHEIRALAGNPFIRLSEEEAEQFLELLRTSLECEAADWTTRRPALIEQL